MDFAFDEPAAFYDPPTQAGDRLDWLRLIRSRRVGPQTFHRLMAEHGTAAAALAALPGIAAASGLTGYEACPDGVVRAEAAAARAAGARMLCRGEDGYPAALAAVPDAPPVLWVIGDAGLLNRPAVALVGARNASSLGLRMARRLAEGLGAAGFAVVSGLARGIDAEAHQAALATGTVAVMAGGVDVVYPPENAGLAAEIAAEGCRISEQPMGLQPQTRHFPQRNRLISGLSRAVVVVEAAERSGSLITARSALDQGREVLAVPGHPFDARAAGCNMLIRDGATLVRGPADVVAAVGHGVVGRAVVGRGTAVEPGVGQGTGGQVADRHGTWRDTDRSDSAPRRTSAAAPEPPASAPVSPLTRATGLHALILARLGPSPLPEDLLIRDLALPAGEVAAELVALELEGRVQRQAGGLLSRLD